MFEKSVQSAELGNEAAEKIVREVLSKTALSCPMALLTLIAKQTIEFRKAELKAQIEEN